MASLVDLCASIEFPPNTNSPSLTEQSESPNEEDLSQGGYHFARVGDTLKQGRYRVLSRLGSGHFSTVWLCHDTHRPSKPFVSSQRQNRSSQIYGDSLVGSQPSVRFEDGENSNGNTNNTAHDATALSVGSESSSTIGPINDRNRNQEVGNSLVKASQEFAGSVVAVKIQKSAQRYTEAALDEIKLLQAIRRNDPLSRMPVVGFLDSFNHYGPNGKHVCIVFDVLGCSLLSLIRRFGYGGVPLPLVKAVTYNILRGLDFLHATVGIIHTDLKPENILMVPSQEDYTALNQEATTNASYMLAERQRAFTLSSTLSTQLTNSKSAARRTGEPLLTRNQRKRLKAKARKDACGESGEKQHHPGSNTVSDHFTEASGLSTKLFIEQSKPPQLDGSDMASVSFDAPFGNGSTDTVEVENNSEFTAATVVGRCRETEAEIGATSGVDDNFSEQGRKGRVTDDDDEAVQPSLLVDDSRILSNHGDISSSGESAGISLSWPVCATREEQGSVVHPGTTHSRHSNLHPNVSSRRKLRIGDWMNADAAYRRADVKIIDLGNACWFDSCTSGVIQTRQYRSPEVILGAGFHASADMWSVACLVFELVTGEFLFDPHTGDGYDRDEDHLGQMIELLGPMPRSVFSKGEYAREFFNRRGELRHIRRLSFWPLERVLKEKHEIPAPEAKELCDFLLGMLQFEPKRRATAAESLQHPFLRECT